MKTISELGNVELRESLEAVKAEIQRIVGKNIQFIIYGSYARGEEREDSDVDLMVVLPDEKASYEIQDRIRNVIYDAGFEMEKHYSVMVVSESQARKHSGFMVFGNVEREGIAV